MPLFGNEHKISKITTINKYMEIKQFIKLLKLFMD